MIEVENLTKRYGAREVLSGLSFSVSSGEVLAFLGANGAGKTTTMRILTGYAAPSGGRASVAGFDVTRQSIAARRHLGYLPETPALYPEMRLREYLDFAGRLKGLRGHALRQRIDSVLADCDLAQAADRLLAQLSKGYRQRAGIAQALLANPPVLILDEPTSGLDPIQAARTRALIARLAPSRTILFSTHLLSEAEAVAGRVLVLAHGKVLADGPVEALARTVPAAALTVRLSAHAPGIGADLAQLPGVRDARSIPGQSGSWELEVTPAQRPAIDAIGQVATRHGVEALEIIESPRPLERLFASIVSEEALA